MKDKIVIIGAGLTGLTIAYLLQKRGIETTIIESRDRIGGRIYTVATESHSNLDLGAIWFGFKHTNLKNLLDELNIRYFKQYLKGESALVYNSMVPPHLFEANSSDESSYRIENGSKTIINRLSESISSPILFNQKIVEIIDQESHLELITNKRIKHRASNVIITVPPKLIHSQIKFIPELSIEVNSVLKSTHTWMSNSAKFVCTYKKPFWRDIGKSGMIISQIAPTTEVYDHTNYSENEFALMGFINQNLRSYTISERQSVIVDYLCEYLSSEAQNYIDYIEKDWSLDTDTTKENDINNTAILTSYGNSIFDQKFMNDKIYFAGTETSKHYGGYMEGAISSAIRMSKII